MAVHEDGKNELAFKVPQLLHPELMTIEDIKTVLSDRCIKLSNLRTMNKEELVAVMHRVAVPFPQRDCFRKKGRRRSSFDAKYSANNSASIASNASKRDPNTSNVKLTNCINYERKTIKLKKTADSSEPTEVQVTDEKMITAVSLKRTATDCELSKDDVDSHQKKEAEEECANPCDEVPAKKSRSKISWP